MKRYLTIIFSIFLFCIQSLAYTVVIDPGHGGRDVGAVGRISQEKNINLKVALALGNLIKKNYPGIKVVYTRNKDTFVELGRRAQIANKANADLFISIHTNSTAAGRKGTTAQGTETYTLGMHRAADNLAVAKRENSVITLEQNYKQTYENFNPNSSESYIIFEFMQDQYMASSVDFARLIQKQFATTAKRVNKGVHQAGFLVLREVSMPSVLIELGFINNRKEEKYLASEWGQKQLAKSIYNAFQAYYKKNVK
jgi:N-acetylmuramoyl-L-alanine amidase